MSTREHVIAKITSIALYRYLPIAAALTLAFVAAAFADEEFESHGTHEHGVAMLNIALDAKRVEVEFESPSINVIGFEHAPRDASERAAVTRAEKLLRDSQKLFTLPPAAQCRLLSAEVNAPDWQKSSGHSDYEARYVYECNQPQAVRSIDVQMVRELAGETKLRVQVVGPNTQTMTELTKAKSVVRLQ